MGFFTPGQVVVLSQTEVRVGVLVRFDFASGTKRVWNGNQELVTLNGSIWQPTYGAAAIDGIGQSGGATSEVVTLTLNGLPDQQPDLLAIALAETNEVDQRLMRISLQFFDEEWQCVGNPLGIFFGWMQPPKVSRSQMTTTEGAVQSISLQAENAFFNRARPANGRLTDRDQQQRFPGDKGLQFSASLLFKKIVWP
jgi:hypothetical protein